MRKHLKNAGNDGSNGENLGGVGDKYPTKEDVSKQFTIKALLNGQSLLNALINSPLKRRAEIIYIHTHIYIFPDLS